MVFFRVGHSPMFCILMAFTTDAQGKGCISSHNHRGVLFILLFLHLPLSLLQIPHTFCYSAQWGLDSYEPGPVHHVYSDFESWNEICVSHHHAFPDRRSLSITYVHTLNSVSNHAFCRPGSIDISQWQHEIPLRKHHLTPLPVLLHTHRRAELLP